MLAYLVIREGSKWTDVFRLVPGRTVTIGRAPTNQIVVKDERCSRNHSEIFQSDGRWVLRDLDSRNGTAIADERVHGDRVLNPGDIIRIAHAQLAFVHDLSTAFADSGSALPLQQAVADETVVGRLTEDIETGEFELFEPTTITHRRGQTRFLAPEDFDNVSIPIHQNREAKFLWHLAFELAKQTDITSVANRALDRLFQSTHVDSGAVLLLPRDLSRSPTDSDLEIIASRSDLEPSYHRVSSFLATTVLRDGEAILARNIEGDSTLGTRDSKGEIHTTSVMCAPIRQGSNVVGMIHLYSTDATSVPNPDELELTLAVAENVALALRNLGRQQELSEHLSMSKNEVTQLRKRLGVESEIIGSSPLTMQVHDQISQAAPSRATVLIRGESGVGKELVARAMHFSSPRKAGPFICLNCAALSESLLESELFGHERGAFTGATERKIGKFEASDKGTLLLDEIGEMSHSVQAKFLRVLEGHPFERVGGTKPITVDVRVIAATNRDLEKGVSEGRFRRDLYFRLRVVEILVPPLRKRPEDICDLVDHFLERFNLETGRRIRGFTPEALESMLRYRWPGNVRELKNVVERAVVLTRGDTIGLEDLNLTSLTVPGDSAEISPESAPYKAVSLRDVEMRHVLSTLRATSWNKSRTATILGIERSTLDRKIKRYELTRDGKTE